MSSSPSRQLNVSSFYGGRNDCAIIGDTRELFPDRSFLWADFDLMSCYPSGMSLIPRLDVEGEVDLIPITYRFVEKARVEMARQNVPANIISEVERALGNSQEAFERLLQKGRRYKRVSGRIRKACRVTDRRLLDRWIAMEESAVADGGAGIGHYAIPGFATVEFSFPEETLFPCLPVKHEKFGLIYSLRGITSATAGEILLAIRAGATVTPLTSMEIPVLRDKDDRPVYLYREFMREKITERERLKNIGTPEAKVRQEIFKNMLNGTYGKVAQGINFRRVYRPSKGRMIPLKGSKVTDRCSAALITGTIRCVLSAILLATEEYNRQVSEGERLVVGSFTTDGATLGVPVPLEKRKSFSGASEYYDDRRQLCEDVDITPAGLLERFDALMLTRIMEGYLPVRQMMNARHHLTGNAEILEVKHLMDYLVSIKTRGMIGYLNGGECVFIAKCGHKIEKSSLMDDVEDPDGEEPQGNELRDREAGWIQGFLDYVRQGDDAIKQYNSERIVGFRDIAESEGHQDMTNRKVTMNTNFTYDGKRRPVVEMCCEKSVLTAETRPHESLSEMLRWRRMMEYLRRKGYVARLDQVEWAYALDGLSFKDRDGKAVSTARMVLRGIVQGRISVQQEYSYAGLAAVFAEIWTQPQFALFPKRWNVSDCKNAKGAPFIPGSVMPTPIAQSVAKAISAKFGVSEDDLRSLLFDAEASAEATIGLVEMAVSAMLHPESLSREPFRSLLSSGMLPGRDLLAIAFPRLSESQIERCASHRIETVRPSPADRERLRQIFRLAGVPAGRCSACASAVMPSQGVPSKSPRNPVRKKCLEAFVRALWQPGVVCRRPVERVVIDKLAPFGLKRRGLALTLEGQFTFNSLDDTAANRRQIRAMACALRIDPVPFVSALIIHD